jgi:lysozyme
VNKTGINKREINMSGVFVEGIDVSHWQGNINWSKVSNDGIHFALMKASEARTYKDNKFERNWKGCKDYGIARGAYHFFRPNTGGKVQADNLLEQLDKVNYGGGGDLIPTIDCEDYDGSGKAKYRKDLQACLDRLEQKIGKKPMIYTLRSFWKKIGNPDFSSYPLWVVDLSSTSKPRLPKHWATYVIWQYTFTGSVSGISGDVDRDRFRGGLSDLGSIGA